MQKEVEDTVPALEGLTAFLGVHDTQIKNFQCIKQHPNKRELI